MFIIDCPWCGARDQSEFSTHGEAHIVRPEDPETVDDTEWGQYVFYRNNVKGWYRERWMHAFGCRRWFNVLRNTASDAIATTYVPGAPRPSLPEDT
ncbi:MAG: sarcosine oxidase subunit delta [Alphaproteobacteria bacterium]|nr:sarcosine oxidase subunit delta [Alphaproteobacteria bacterium]